MVMTLEAERIKKKLFFKIYKKLIMRKALEKLLCTFSAQNA
jgi:hypothetical protein